MKLTTLLASATLFATLGAQAQVVGTIGGGDSDFLSLSAAGLDGGAVATLSGGGAVLSAADPALAGGVIPTAAVSGGVLVAAPSYGSIATLSFTGAGQSSVGFLWGSPDYYNQLTVTTTGGVTNTFDAAGLGLNLSSDVASLGTPQYVQFTADAGSMITGLTFDDSPDYAGFEVANFSVTAAVPEPQTYALMLGGLGIIGFVARRRRT